MARTILAVLAGFLLTMALLTLATMLTTKAFVGTPQFAARLTLSAAVALLGGYTTALLAGRLPALHALVVAGAIFFLGLMAYAQTANQQQAIGQPRWYTLTLLILTPLCVFGGGVLRFLRVRRASAGPLNHEVKP